MSDSEILEITGSQLVCTCWSSGNRHKGRDVKCFVRASTVERARQTALLITGERHCTASPYLPWRDPVMRKFVTAVQ